MYPTSIKAVFFDLDDTLFDHWHSTRQAFATIQRTQSALESVHVDDWQTRNTQLLDELHPRVLTGELTLDAARVQRFTRLMGHYNPDAAPELGAQIAEAYRAAYQEHRQPVPGALDLLAALRGRVQVGLITNNVVLEQLDKLRVCQLDALIDVLVISEEVGAAKPDPRIFEVALQRAGCRAAEAVMVGDSWPNDVLGAVRAGLQAVWLNRFGLPCPDPQLARQIAGFGPVERVAELLITAPEADVER